jgi:hypothetical protein
MNNRNGLHIQIVIFALITSVLTALANLLVENIVGINVFSFGLWLIIPVGAVIIGMGGASGGFLACKYFNIMPSKLDAIALILIAAFTMFLIYYMGYSTLVLDDGVLAKDVVDFGTYLDVVVTKAHMKVGRALNHDTGEVGSFGYWLLVIRFVGVLIGGFAIFASLKELPVCSDCDVYFKKIGVKENLQPNSDTAQTILDKIRSGNEEDYASAIQSTGKGDCDVKIEFTLMRCPKCRSELVTEEFFVKSKDKNFVADKNLNGKTLLPKDTIITSLFDKK